MCGIVGYIGPKNLKALEAMSEVIRKRGPDASALLSIGDNVHFAHRRLAILDLNPSGEQPMWSHDGRYCIIYNGEIYNFHELRKLVSRDWKGHSDTEVLLECISYFGISKALDLINGMFAFALFDRHQNQLILARDRFGEKPLYYGTNNGIFYFGSQVNSFQVHPQFRTKLNQTALTAFFQLNCVPAPHSIFEGIFKLPPAHYYVLNLGNQAGELKCYWNHFAEKKKFSKESASDELEKLLLDSVRKQMISDVPLGAFLSGGVDSSLVAALMQKQSMKPVKTFTIGFHETEYNEAAYAKRVAAHLGTEHIELYVSAKDALNVIPKLHSIYDEPFADVSQIPTYLLCSMTRKHVTVALSGDAGDEIFGGYNRYLFAPKIHGFSTMLPHTSRKLISEILSLSARPFNIHRGQVGTKIQKIADVLKFADKKDIYRNLISQWKQGESPVLNPESFQVAIPDIEEFTEMMMLADRNWYLPDDILVKVDRASMAVSLETRVPFLDRHVVEMMTSVPTDLKVNDGNGKILLRNILYKYVPKDLIERPKQGFNVPIDSWLRNELKEWARNLIDEKKLREQGILDWKMVHRRWDEHQSGKKNWQHQLWAILMFQEWYENSIVR